MREKILGANVLKYNLVRSESACVAVLPRVILYYNIATFQRAL